MLSHIMLALSWLSPLSLLFGIVGAVKNRSSLKVLEQVITLFLLLFLAIDLYSRPIFDRFAGISNLSILAFYSLIEYVFLAMLYTRFFPTRTTRILKFISIVIFIIMLGPIIFKLLEVDFLEFQMYESVWAYFSILCFGLFFIYKVLTEQVQTSAQYRSLNGVIILYTSVQIFMTLTINFMVNTSVETAFFFWLIRLVVLVVFYLKLSQIIWQAGKKIAR